MCEQVRYSVQWHLHACMFSKLLCVCSIASTVLLMTTTPQQAGYVLGPKMKLYIFCMLVTCHASLHCLPLKKIAQSAFWANVTVLLGQPAAAYAHHHGCNTCGHAVHLPPRGSPVPTCLHVPPRNKGQHAPMIACLQHPLWPCLSWSCLSLRPTSCGAPLMPCSTMRWACLDSSYHRVPHPTQVCFGPGLMPCRMCQGLVSRYHTLLHWRLLCPLLLLPGMLLVDP